MSVRARRRASLVRVALLVPPGVFVAVFFVWPVVTLIVRGLHWSGSWDLSSVLAIVRDRSLRRIAWFTLWQSVVSTILCLVLGVAGAALFARFRFPGRRALWAALLVPFVLPTVVVGVALIAVIGPGSFTGVELTGTIWAILVGHVFFNYAVVVRMVGSAWATLDPSPYDAARMLGASPLRATLTVTLPTLRTVLLSAAAIVFLFCFTSFGIVLVLGSVQHRTIEVEIWEQTTRYLHLDVAAGLAIAQLVLVVAVLVVFARLQSRRSFAVAQRAGREVARRARTFGARVFVVANLALLLALFGLPLGVLIVRSLSTPEGFGFGFYRSLSSARSGTSGFVAPIDAIGNSLLFALATMVIAVVLGACAAWAIAGGGGGRFADRLSGIGDTVLMIPLGTSAVTVGFGMLITFDRPPVDLRASSVLVPLSHAVVALPFVVRLLVPAIRAIDPRIRDAATMLGASPARRWRRIDMPILGRATAAAAGFAFAVSLGEFGATAFLARPDRPTVPIAIYRALGRPGEWNLGQAMAMSTILMVMTSVVMIVIDRLRPLGESEF